MNHKNELLTTLLAKTLAAPRQVPPTNPSLTGSARDAAANARVAALNASNGWLPVPHVATERTRQRIVRRLIDDGLLDESETGRARMVRLTDAGIAAAEALTDA